MLVPLPSTDFLKQFLVTRQLTRPTGMPLYTYKISRTEYEQLRTLLVRASASADTTSACFMLFATEWWRRNYDGGHWEWEPVFNEIQRPDWGSQSKRNQLMNSGCRYWGRQLFQHENGNNSLLGTLFFESGIPVGVLTNESYIKGLITKSFSFLETYSTERADTFDCIRDLARSNQLPNALNVDPFFDLIYKVIKALLHLKTTCQLGSREQPLTYLNENVPNWREALPLRIDDHDGASAFLDSLLVDVAKASRQEVSKIGVSYRLSQVQDVWMIKTALHIPNGLYKPAHIQVDEATLASFSTKLHIKVTADTTETFLGYAFKNGNGDVSVSGLSNVTLPGLIYAKPWRLIIADGQTDNQASIDLPYSDGLDPAMPWVFAAQEEGAATLKGVGSTRLSSSRAIVVCPASFIVDATEGAVKKLGAFSESQTVYELSATCMLRDEQDDQLFRVRLSQPTDDNFYVALHPQTNGHCLPFFQKLNANNFLGFPRIRRVHKSGGFTLASRDTIQYKSYQHKAWQTVADTSSLLGRFKIRSVGPDGDVLFSKEIAVLPADFKVRFDAAKRSILLDSTAAFTLSIRNDEPSLELAMSKSTNQHQVIVSGSNQPAKLTVLLSTATAREITLHVPYPTAAGTFRDRSGMIMANGKAIDLQMLYGASLMLTNVSSTAQVHNITLTLNDIHNRESSAFTIDKQIRMAPFSNQEIPLTKYRSAIERLLSFARAIDAVVRIQHNRGTSIYVSQYTYQARYDYPSTLVTLGGTVPEDADIRIRAFPLSERFTTESLVDLALGDGGWQFPAHCAEGGKWFFFSAADSTASIRPSVAIRTELIEVDTRETVDELHEASNHSFDNRQAVLTNLFDRMGDDFENVNWTTLDLLYKATKHLPMNALDVWKALICSNKGLVAFFLRFDSIPIAALSRAFSVNWHLIPIATWLEGFQAFHTYLTHTTSDAVARIVLVAKVQELESSFSLISVGQIIRTNLLDEAASQEFSSSGNTLFVKYGLSGPILGGGGQSGLLHQTKEKFPVHLSPDLLNAFKLLPNPIQDLLPTIPPNFGYIRPVTYLPIVLAYHSVHPDKLPISNWDRHKVMQLIDFDTDYFNQTLNLIQSYCWLTLANQTTPTL
ncbi:STY4851/ECs_5259 family protein [uncultured Fibrella sp.]|uniref:STY4851/ECs_5259 family protein n=1 Tax=uncultured Fibrella sp. TaxID=1284596 RepID=UPI0035C9AFB1